MRCPHCMSPSTVKVFQSTISECVDVISRAGSSRLQLNPDKTEALWCATTTAATVDRLTVCWRSCFSDKIRSQAGHLHWRRSVYADARTKNGFAVLCCSQTAPSDPCRRPRSRCWSSGLSCLGSTVTTVCYSWHPSLPTVLGTVGAECGGTADFSSEARWSYHGRPISLHWLRVPQRSHYKIAPLT